MASKSSGSINGSPGFGKAVFTNGNSTATITGYPTSASFPVGATLQYPDGDGGDQTVTCTGQLLFNDGTTANSNPNGSVKVTAVQVDSISLIPKPGSQTVGQTTTTTNYTASMQD